jgi:hypothetical protein
VIAKIDFQMAGGILIVGEAEDVAYPSIRPSPTTQPKTKKILAKGLERQASYGCLVRRTAPQDRNAFNSISTSEAV